MNYTKAYIEILQAEACLEFLIELDGRIYKLGDRPDSQSQKRAPDFAFYNESNDFIGVIEVTSSAEYQRPKTEEDQFEFEQIFESMKTEIENFASNWQLECEYSLAIQDPSLNFLKRDYWEIFAKALKEAVNYLETEWKNYGAEECVNTKSFYCEFGNKKYEFRLTRENKAHPSFSNPISVMRMAKWVDAPDLEGLDRALNHINHKFQEYKKSQGGVSVNVGLIDVKNWPAAEDAIPQELAKAKLKFPMINRLFLIDYSPSERSGKQPENWKKYGHYQLMKVW